jgi:ABC-type phosphate/phosphonate transport system substrate-binding protein
MSAEPRPANSSLVTHHSFARGPDAGRKGWAVTQATRLAVVVLAVMAGVVPAPAQAPATAPNLKIGMLKGMFRDVQPAMVMAMSGPLRQLMTRQTGLDGQVELVSDAQTLAAKMASKELQVGVFHGFEFAWVSPSNPDIVPLVVTVPPGRSVQACVVVHKTSPAKKLADLKDESVLIPKGTKAHCLLFLDRERTGFVATTAAPAPNREKTVEDALDGVVTGDFPAALVDAAALSGYQSLQPGAYKHLRVLAESEKFPPAVIAYRRGALDEATAGRIKSGLVTAHQSVTSRPLMMLWNLKGFEDVPADYQQRLADIRKAYPAPAGGGK